jgi:hypothetical protein
LTWSFSLNRLGDHGLLFFERNQIVHTSRHLLVKLPSCCK